MTKTEMSDKPKQQYITPAGLKARGWTDGMIKKFLGEPDATRDNPHFKCAAPMRLYELKRVERVEKRKTFIAEKEASAVRKQSAAKGVATKREKAMQYASTVGIHVPQMDYDKLVKQACKSYNQWNEYDRRGYYNDNFIPASVDSDPDFLRRIITNYLRHECTSYEQELYTLYGKTGVSEAHDILQQRINAEIRRVYPELK